MAPHASDAAFFSNQVCQQRPRPCINASLGCSFRGPSLALNSHLGVCPAYFLCCVICGEDVRRSQVRMNGVGLEESGVRARRDGSANS